MAQWIMNDILINIYHVHPAPVELQRALVAADAVGVDSWDDSFYVDNSYSQDAHEWMVGDFLELLLVQDTMQVWTRVMPELLEKACGQVIYYQPYQANCRTEFGYRVFFGPVDEAIERIRTRTIMARRATDTKPKGADQEPEWQKKRPKRSGR